MLLGFAVGQPMPVSVAGGIQALRLRVSSVCRQIAARFGARVSNKGLRMSGAAASPGLSPDDRDLMHVEQLIRRYGLQPHPEGGWYREVHRSDGSVSRRDGQQRAALTAILFLLPRGEISRWHRVSGADETWHHAGGAPLELLCLPPGGGSLRRQRLASLAASGPAVSPAQGDPRDQSEPLAVVPAGWWQAARSLGAWSLVSCCVGPGFEFADFSLLRDLPEAEWPPGALPELL